jgi:UDP-N-acetylmuramate--alanine ligase
MHVLFQPHRYSRTFHLLDDFARAFHQADRVLVLDIYAASEKPIEGVTAEALVDRMRQFGHRGAEYAGSNAAGVEMIVQGVEPGDMILTLGAGSVSQLAEKILESLNA